MTNKHDNNFTNQNNLPTLEELTEPLFNPNKYNDFAAELISRVAKTKLGDFYIYAFLYQEQLNLSVVSVPQTANEVGFNNKNETAKISLPNHYETEQNQTKTQTNINIQQSISLDQLQIAKLIKFLKTNQLENHEVFELRTAIYLFNTFNFDNDIIKLCLYEIILRNLFLMEVYKNEPIYETRFAAITEEEEKEIITLLETHKTDIKRITEQRPKVTPTNPTETNTTKEFAGKIIYIDKGKIKFAQKGSLKAFAGFLMHEFGSKEQVYSYISKIEAFFDNQNWYSLKTYIKSKQYYPTKKISKDLIDDFKKLLDYLGQ